MKYKFKPSHIVPAYLFAVAVLYGGSKPPVTTNTPPVLMTHVKSVTESGEAESLPLLPEATRSTDVVHGALSLQAEGIPLFHSVSNWTARGAYCDWLRVTFPDGFEFPYGTNLLTGVTLMAYGELRCNDGALAVGPHQPATTGASSLRIAALPQPVSLEPGVSSFVYGLTSSNSFVFAWQNVCVNRSPTNRVDASIELFRNGAILTTTQPTNQPTNKLTNYIPALPPPGYVGSAQDNDWAAAAFSPTDYAAITNKGYDAWLMEDKVGINEQNGLYKATITVHSMPPNDEPCYLECGPYRVIVTEPGEYSFPLQVFTHYTARTYPTPVPLSVEYDDGYRGSPSLLGAPAPQNSAPRLMGFGLPLILPIYLDASMHVWPSSIELSQARNAVIEIWCNVASFLNCGWESESGETSARFICPSLLEITEARIEDRVRIFLTHDCGISSCEIPITVPDNYHWCCCGNCSGENCSCGCDCPNHHIHDDGTNAPPQTGTQP